MAALCLIILFSPMVSNASYIDLQKPEIKITQYWWEKAPEPVINGQKCPKTWWDAAILTSKHHGSNPFDIIAVMRMESGPNCFSYGGQTVGKGKNGRKYIRPMGFNRSCKIPYEYMYVPEKQIYWAGMRLAGDQINRSNGYYSLSLNKAYLIKRLKIYNTTWYKNSYIPGVVNLSRQLEREAFDQVFRLQRYGF